MYLYAETSNSRYLILFDFVVDIDQQIFDVLLFLRIGLNNFSNLEAKLCSVTEA